MRSKHLALQRLRREVHIEPLAHVLGELLHAVLAHVAQYLLVLLAQRALAHVADIPPSAHVRAVRLPVGDKLPVPEARTGGAKLEVPGVDEALLPQRQHKELLIEPAPLLPHTVDFDLTDAVGDELRRLLGARPRAKGDLA